MVKQGLYIYAWSSVSYEGVIKFFDKLTVKPKSSESAASGREYALPGQLKRPRASGALCVHLALSVRMLESVEPFRRLPSSDGFDDIN